jgi:hypothetical protein
MPPQFACESRLSHLLAVAFLTQSQREFSRGLSDVKCGNYISEPAQDMRNDGSWFPYPPKMCTPPPADYFDAPMLRLRTNHLRTQVLHGRMRRKPIAAECDSKNRLRRRCKQAIEINNAARYLIATCASLGRPVAHHAPRFPSAETELSSGKITDYFGNDARGSGEK